VKDKKKGLCLSFLFAYYFDIIKTQKINIFAKVMLSYGHWFVIVKIKNQSRGYLIVFFFEFCSQAVICFD